MQKAAYKGNNTDEGKTKVSQATPEKLEAIMAALKRSHMIDKEAVQKRFSGRYLLVNLFLVFAYRNSANLYH